MKWFVRHRLDWIAEMLAIYGFINREHLQKKFEVSQQQASIDLNRFLYERPGLMQYDKRKKCYVATN